MNRPYPNNKTKKNYIINNIKAKFIKESHNPSRWSTAIVGLHSQAAKEFLTTLPTKFGESLNHLRGDNSFKTVLLPNNNQVEIVADHHIKVQDYGELQVVQNISKLHNTTSN